MASDPRGISYWVITLDKEELKSVHHQDHKLDLNENANLYKTIKFYIETKLHQLNGSEISLPRQDDFRVHGAHGRHEIIEIHQDVDEGVYKGRESRVASTQEASTEKDVERHHGMMHDMQ